MICFVNKIYMINKTEKRGGRMEAPEGKKFYGSVTVSERGQIVIPADARKDFGIKTGDKLLIFGDLERGLAMATLDIMQKTMEGTIDLYREIGTAIKQGVEKKE
jgi:AbrB family looped-hinge helix DNA binding protein